MQLNTSSQLDLTAADLDFAGYCGEVYAAGMGGAMLLHGVAGISVDPCDELGQDSDHTRYTLPLCGGRSDFSDGYVVSHRPVQRALPGPLPAHGGERGSDRH